MLSRVDLFLAFAALVCLQVAVLSAPDEFDDAEEDFSDFDQPNIVGGHIVKKGKIPYQVSLRSKNSFNRSRGHFCGATIVDRRHVLTAAHCARLMENAPENFYVVTGSISLADSKRRYEIAKITIHDEYSPYTMRNDVAVIKLKKLIKFNRYTKPRRIVRRVPKKGVKCLISGWGTWRPGDYFLHDELKVAVVPISDTKECVANYSGRVDPKTMICAGRELGGVDSCQGDSGGPMICKGGLAGIVSWGRSCGLAGYPGVYTNAHTYVPWLKKKRVAVKVLEDGDDDDEFAGDDEEIAAGVSDESDESDEANVGETPETESVNEKIATADKTMPKPQHDQLLPFQQQMETVNKIFGW